MADAIADNRKPRGRPKVDSVLVGVRIPPDLLARLDAWISAQPPRNKPITRPDAIRGMMEAVLTIVEKDTPDKRR